MFSRLLLTNAALAAVFRAVLAVFAIFAGMTRIVAGAGREDIGNRVSVEYKRQDNELSEDRNESGLSHSIPPGKIQKGTERRMLPFYVLVKIFGVVQIDITSSTRLQPWRRAQSRSELCVSI
jgi:hypothetical protein